MPGRKSSHCPHVGVGAVLPLEPPAGLISLNTGMKVISGRALFYIGKRTATLE